MSASDVQAKLQEAIMLAQAGQRAEARAMLRQVVEADPDQELAWLWLATVSTDRDERIGFLERALALNPDNPTSRQAYAQLTGRDYTPPATSRPGKAGGRWQALTRDASLSPVNIVILMAVAAVGVAAIVVALNLRGEADGGSQPTVAPLFLAATEMLTPTSRYSPTPSYTPRPTSTPGPSPTSVWDNPPPTWTPAPTLTTAPSNTPLPSSTPLPTRTNTPTPLSHTPTSTRLPPSNTPPPLFPPAEEQTSPTSTRTPTLDSSTATAEAALTLTAAVPADESLN